MQRHKEEQAEKEKLEKDRIKKKYEINQKLEILENFKKKKFTKIEANKKEVETDQNL